jgi:hypothetical protein
MGGTEQTLTVVIPASVGIQLLLFLSSIKPSRSSRKVKGWTPAFAGMTGPGMTNPGTTNPGMTSK